MISGRGVGAQATTPNASSEHRAHRASPARCIIFSPPVGSAWLCLPELELELELACWILWRAWLARLCLLEWLRALRSSDFVRRGHGERWSVRSALACARPFAPDRQRPSARLPTSFRCPRCEPDRRRLLPK